MPQNVCAICLKKVIELHNFKETCTRSEIILKDVIRRECLIPEPINYLKNKIIVPKEEVKTIDEDSCEEFYSQENYEQFDPQENYEELDENLEVLSPVCINEIDIAKEEVIANPECEQNTDDIVLENAVRKKPRKTRARKKITVKKVKLLKPITLPKILVKKPQKTLLKLEFKCRVCDAVFENKEDFR